MNPTTLGELTRWMNEPEEHERLEFKAARKGFHSDRIMAYCVALSNEGGGKLILGVTNNRPRKVLGTEAAIPVSGTQKKIVDTLRFLVIVEEFKHPDGRVVIFHIPPREQGSPREHGGRFWMRSKDELRTMSTQRLREIIEEGKPNWLICPARKKCTGTEVLSLLSTQTFYKLLNLPYPASQSTILDRFISEGLTTKEGDRYSISNLGAVLFAKRLAEFEGLERKAPRVVVYAGKDKLEGSRFFQPGDKGYAIGFEGLVNYINRQIPANEVIGKVFREKVKMFPEEAIRELVANALIHQDFNETGTSVTVEIYSDRLQVINPGEAIISPDRFVDGFQSRNERLAGIMRRLRICEEQGLGVDRVIKSAEDYQLPAPYFGVGERQTVTILYAHKKFEEMDRKERIRACFQHCALRWEMNQKMTNASLRERFNLPESKLETVSAIIADTMHAGKIKPDDPSSPSRRYAKYVPYWV